MILVADTHIHIYPNYSLEIFFKECFKKINEIKGNLNSKVVAVICLTEIVGCNYFQNLSDTDFSNEFTVKDYSSFKIVQYKDESLYVFPGFQTNTKEKVEVLELFTTERVSAGKSLEETISLITKKKAFPVISWSFGKWLGKRGELIRKLIKKGDLSFALGDSALRFVLHPVPNLFKVASAKKFRIICGSDPLPLNGEERVVFEYYSKYADFSPKSEGHEDVARLIKDIISNETLKSSGRRNSFFKFLVRWLRVMYRKA